MSEAATTQPSEPAAAKPDAPAQAPAPSAPAPASDGPWARELGEIVAKAVADALAKVEPVKPVEPAKPATTDETATRIARLEQMLAQQAAAEQRTRFEAAALAGVPASNLDMARTLLAGVVGSSQPDMAKVAEVRTRLEALMPTLYREPGSTFAALPVKAGDNSIDWAAITNINQLPEGSMHMIPPEHWDRLTRGGGSSSSTLPKTNTSLRLAK